LSDGHTEMRRRHRGLIVVLLLAVLSGSAAGTSRARGSGAVHAARVSGGDMVANAAPARTLPANGLARYGTSNGWRYPFRAAAEQDFELSKEDEVGAKLMRIGCSASTPTVSAVDKMRSHGIEPVCLLGGNPTYPWAQTVSQFASSCGSTATTLIGKARLFEPLNEPNLHNWSPDSYLPYLRACYAAIKRANPNATVLHAGLWTSAAWPLINWVQRLYAIGGRPYFDAMNVHLYDDSAEHGSWSIWDMTYGSGGAGFYDARNVRSVMNANGDANKPIVSTESGGPVPKYSREKQATIVADALKSADGIGTGNRKTLFVLIYNMLDDDVPGFGMLDSARAPRPSFYAFQARARAG
jgi:hypothetical protein